MYINGVFLHQFQPWFLIIAPLNLPLKWAIPIVQSHLWAMNHSPSVAPPKSFPGIARFDDTRPDTAWAWAQRNSETKRCSRQWRQIGQNKTRIYRFTYSYRSIHLYIYRYHIYIYIYKSYTCVYIYILCIYIYMCVHTSGICTPRPESQPEELQHRPPRAVRTSSPAPGGPGVDFYSFTLVMYNVYVYVYTYTYIHTYIYDLHRK